MIFIKGVEVFPLLLRDGFALRHGDLAYLGLVWLARALLGLDRILKQHAGRRALKLNVERAILVDPHQAADDLALEVGGHRVELLDELAWVHTVLTERRADRRRRRGCAAGGLELE